MIHRRQIRYERIGKRYAHIFSIRALMAFVLSFILFVLTIYFFTYQDSYTNFVLLTDDIYYFYQGQGVNTANVIFIPNELYIETEGGYGIYPVKSLAELDNNEKADGSIISKTIEKNLALPVSYVFNFKDTVRSQNPSGNIKQIFTFKNLFNPRSLSLNNFISLLQSIRMFFHIKFTPDENINYFYLNKIPSTSEMILPDGRKINLIDSSKLDLVLEQNFEIPAIRAENYSISVFNASDKPGYATQVARLIDHLGFYVTSTENYSEAKSGCIIKIKKFQLKTESYKILKRIFHCSLEEPDSNTESDIGLIIGK